MIQVGKFTLLVALLCQAALFSSCSNKSATGDSTIDGLGKFTYAIVGGRASLSIVFDNLQIDAGVVIPLARPAGAFIEMSPDFFTLGTLFKISVPVASLFQGNGDLTQIGLPDGRPLPGVKNGMLGALVANLPVLGNVFLYMGSDVFGIFFPLPLPNVPVMVTFKIRDDKGNLLGILSGIPKGAKGTISGALFLFPVEGSSSSSLMSRVL